MLTAPFLTTVPSSTPSTEAAQDTQAKGYYGLEPSVVAFHNSGMTHLHVSV